MPKGLIYGRPWLNPESFSHAVRVRRRRGRITVGFITGGLFFTTSVRFRVPFVDVSLMVLAAAWLGRRPWLGGQEVAPDRRSAA
ncbi:MAG: hypothetical protein WCP53_01700 [Verrucomicrobiota bacterium]